MTAEKGTLVSEPHVGDDLVSVSAPAFAVSPRDGQLRGDGVSGVFHADRRVLSRLLLTVDGAEPEPVHGVLPDGPSAAFAAACRRPEDPPVGVALSVERLRRLVAGAPPTVAEERITVHNRARSPRTVRLRLAVDADLADISEVRSGRVGETGAVVKVEEAADGIWFRSVDDLRVVVRAGDGAAVQPGRDGTPPAFAWTLDLPPGERKTVGVRVDVREPRTAPPVVRPEGDRPWSRPELACADARLGALVRRGLTDLESLLLATPARRADAFVAAGSPWYLTLFGRDSLWSARMMLPLGTRLAAGTLRTLAHFQGQGHDATTEERRGKIMHELRRTATVGTGGLTLPALYYGSVDATPLFVILLAEAWRWGMPAEEVTPLLGPMVRALDWMAGAAGRDGFLSYRPENGHGLANHGWKDSADSVQTADGRLAAHPIALAEVQAYAYQAAMGGADLLEHLGGTDEPDKAARWWREWAAALRTRFRETFWLADEVGPYPAIAVDGDGRPVTGAASNMGHLLGTGLLDPAESARVSHRLGAPDLTTRWGLRTLSARSRGFNPYGYHTGSIWAHDTAIAIRGLAIDGHHAEAARLIESLLTAGAHFDYRLPELWSGDERWPSPVPYPAACRPQAWAAAAAVAVLHALVGLYPDVPGGTYRLAPLEGTSYGITSVAGLRVGGEGVRLRRAGGEMAAEGLAGSRSRGQLP